MAAVRRMGFGLGAVLALGMVGFLTWWGVESSRTPAPVPPKAAHASLSPGQLGDIEFHPHAHRRENVVVFAQVIRVDPEPGHTFLGYVSERMIGEDSFLTCADYAEFVGSDEQLARLGGNDVVEVWATVAGPVRFDTPVLDTNIPSFQVNHMHVVGPVDTSAT